MANNKLDLTHFPTLARPYRIAVTIATYKRPQSLQRLLNALAAEIESLYSRSNNQLTLRIFIAENDMDKCEGAAVVASCAQQFACQVSCISEPRRGVSAIRNTVTASALEWHPDFILFIDDDEWPASHWIEKMIETADCYTADIVSGPVLPAYETPPPKWIQEGKFFEDPHYETGEFPDIKRTSNLLIRTSWLNDKSLFHQNNWFNEALGRYGGEDSMLIELLLAQGAKHVWCNEATVTEFIPRERQTIQYLARRAYRFGNVGLLYRSMLRPDPLSGMVRIGKTSYLLLRWTLLSARILVSKEQRKQHVIELQTVLGRLNAHRGYYRQHY